MSNSLTQANMAVNDPRFGASSPRKSWFGQGLILAVMGFSLAGIPSYAAVSRNVRITAPASVVAGTKVTATVMASTDAGGGEQIGFFHADFSLDGGLTWSGISYLTKAGPTATRAVSFTAGAAGSVAVIRVRVAFRDGKAGDVDYAGKKIDWDTSWNKWQEPPAKLVRISVVAP